MAKDFTYEIRGFGGLAETINETGAANSPQSPDTVNFTLTPDRRLQKREGFRTVRKFEGAIRAIWSGILADTSHCFVVESVRVWHGEGSFDSMEQVGVLPGHDTVQIVEFGGKLFFLSGVGIRRFCPEEGFGELNPYRPLLMAGSGPDGLGTPVEEANLLGGKCRQRFSPKAGELAYHLCLVDVDSVDYVTVNGQELLPSQYRVNLTGGLVTLLQDPPDGGTDSVEIGFTKHNADNDFRVTRCRYASVFGGTNDTALFLWGNATYPAVRLHSGYADGRPSGEYFPETHCVQVADGSALTGVLGYYDRQLLFTRENAYVSAAQSETDAFGRVRTRYPIHRISTAAGNLSPANACLAGNTPVSVTAGGLCRWNSDSLRDETNATVFSQRISVGLGKLAPESLRLFYRRGKQQLYLWSPQKAFYVYDQPTDSFWRLDGWKPECFFEEVATGALYFGTKTGQLCLVGGTDDDGVPITAHWDSGELEIGSGFYGKHLYGLAATVSACAQNRLRVRWTADVEGSSLPNGGEILLESRQDVTDFSRWDFSRLSFLTAYHARNLSKRLRVRRFRRIRLRLEECSDCRLQVESIRLWGRIHEKKL